MEIIRTKHNTGYLKNTLEKIADQLENDELCIIISNEVDMFDIEQYIAYAIDKDAVNKIASNYKMFIHENFKTIDDVVKFLKKCNCRLSKDLNVYVGTLNEFQAVAIKNHEDLQDLSEHVSIELRVQERADARC